MDVQSSSIPALESRDDFEDNPKGQYKYWQIELSASERNLRGFVRQGNDIIRRFLADSPASRLGDIDTGGAGQFLMNLFYANVTTLEATLYGSVPRIDVSRRYADPKDDVGRVASVMMERLLNNDIAENGTETENVLRGGLNDRLTVGLGCARVRYTAQFTDMDGQEVMLGEDALTEYVHWRDVRWGWARSFSEVPWVAFRAYMTKDEAVERFGEDEAKRLTYNVQQALSDDDDTFSADDNESAWMKAEVWEIWDKSKRQVAWVSIGYDKVLDTKQDPLELKGFFPCPPFFIANATSTLYVPTADYHMAQDLYNEIDKLQTRISIITDAVKVVGVYDSTNGEIARMLKEGTDNDLIPVENWALFSEKGGIQGQVDWFPIGDVVSALTQLIQIRDQTIGMLQQVTGMSDLMRGELSNQYEGVGQTQMKAQHGSIRIQALQDQFAQYATDLMQIKAEVIARHWSPETIVKRSNAQRLCEADQRLVGPALELIQKPEEAKLSIKIRPESVAMTDYAKLKNERTEFINALSMFMQSAAPLTEQDPDTTPYLLKLLQWGLAGFKGASEIEGVLDKAIEESEERRQKAKEQPPEKPPEVQVAEMEQQHQMQLEQTKQQGEMAKIQAKAQADIAVRQADMQADTQTALAEHQSALENIQAELLATLAETQAKLKADVQKEEAQMRANILQTQTQAAAEVGKDVANQKLDIEAEAIKTSLKIDEIAASATAKIKEAKAKPEAKSDDSQD